jgi:hypothetical protein
MLIQACFICRKTRAYETTCHHEYSNEHFYAGLNDSIVVIAMQQRYITNENYINLDLRN